MDKFPVPITAYVNPYSYNPLSEIFQSVDIKFTYVDSKGQQVHMPCKCRDFLGDMIWSRKTGKKVSIYGMQYDYKKNPYDLDVTRFSLKFPNPDVMKNFINNFAYLTDREKKYGIPESKLYTTDDSSTLVIEGDKVWQSNVWKISIYTFYIKLMGYKDITQPNQPEWNYANKYNPLEEKFLSKIQLEDEDTLQDLDMAHNYSGFYSIITYPQYNLVASKILASEDHSDDDDDDDDEPWDDD